MELYDLILSAKLTKGGGGSETQIDPLSVTENGTYTAEDGHAYSPVTVDVPQPSGSISITENGTVDVTNYASASVNVSGGGGSGLTLLGEKDFAVTKPANSGARNIGSIINSDFIVNKPLYIRIRDKNGKPADINYYGSDIILVNHNMANGTPDTIYSCAGMCIYVNSSGVYASIDGTSNNTRPLYGIYPTQLSSEGELSLSARTNANTVMDSTYTVQVYSIDLPIA